ncbi:hypothetical protein [Reyranella sp.]|uniref:hypothetical protein n=1 Tax=Reyranella sp. TaxID=1929291 RepID=UPI0027165CB9|nr:hypothetical protein [Reyranella sp.]MDO8973877.1 hypothetical protein [Reyranella sp.]
MSNGERREAERGLIGQCPICEVPLKPKCGRIRVPYWSHPPGHFEHRWEPETEWHRNWKNAFPKEWQEVGHRAENGERHLADVKTAHGQVLEFQHSNISDDERSSREAIYGQMCWVVDGMRSKNDRKKFVTALHLGRLVPGSFRTYIVPTGSSELLRKWENSQKLVMFDFGELEEFSDPFRFGAPVLWGALPGWKNGEAVLRPIYRTGFLDSMTKNEPLVGIEGALEPLRVEAQPRLAPRGHRRLDSNVHSRRYRIR